MPYENKHNAQEVAPPNSESGQLPQKKFRFARKVGGAALNVLAQPFKKAFERERQENERHTGFDVLKSVVLMGAQDATHTSEGEERTASADGSVGLLATCFQTARNRLNGYAEEVDPNNPALQRAYNSIPLGKREGYLKPFTGQEATALIVGTYNLYEATGGLKAFQEARWSYTRARVLSQAVLS